MPAGVLVIKQYIMSSLRAVPWFFISMVCKNIDSTLIVWLYYS